jgi:ketosteroid isomerase-like protein
MGAIAAGAVSIQSASIWRFYMLSAGYVTHVLLVICWSTIASLAQAQAAPSNTSKPEDQVAQLERDWLAADAKGDAARLRQIIADDFVGSSFNGSLLNKEDIIPEGTGPGGFAGATTGETNVRVFGDTGVLMGIINSAGQPQAQRIHVTLVCQKKPQGWQIIAAQLSKCNDRDPNESDTEAIVVESIALKTPVPGQ